MRQFDVFTNPSPAMRGPVPYVVVLSSHLLVDLTEVILAPLVIFGALRPSAFDVPVTFDGDSMLLSVVGLAAISEARLKTRTGSLLAYEDDIRRALDRLFTGF